MKHIKLLLKDMFDITLFVRGVKEKNIKLIFLYILKIVFYIVLLRMLFLSYTSLQQVLNTQYVFFEIAISTISSDYLKYQGLLLFILYLFFEGVVYLISKYSHDFREKIKENPLMIRFCFLGLIVLITLIIVFVRDYK